MIINGKDYKVSDLDFNTVCKLEEKGINLNEINQKPFLVVRGFLAVIMDTDVDTAGKELSQHIINGGDFDELAVQISDLVEKSDFFQALSKQNTN